MTTRNELITNPVLITDDAELARLCEQWSQLSVLALDTEFIRVDTFYPKLGLVQVCDGQGSYLLDPLALSEWSAFIAILRSDSIVKVLHSCSEDLIVFSDFFELVPGPLFDTQRAAAFLGFGYSISYQNLVEELLGIALEKGETRSDWLQRPLSDSQLSYAALDVAYLPEIYAELSKRLKEKDRLQWLQYDCDEMVQLAGTDVNHEQWAQYYQNIGGAWRLDVPQLEALKRLCVWREVQARKRNKPRNWIAKDADLLLICEAMPKDESGLGIIAGLSRHLARQDAKTILNILSQQHSGPVINKGSVEQPLTPTMRKTLKRCQEVVKIKAEALGLAPELLARKKLLLPLVAPIGTNEELVWPATLAGWRQSILEEDIRAALR